MSNSSHLTNSADETRAVGRAIAERLLAQRAAGEVTRAQIVTLEGELGAGKTMLAQGLLAALGAEGPYTSPTFTIVKTYRAQVERRKAQEPAGAQVEERRAQGMEDSDGFPLASFHLRPAVIYHIDPYRITRDEMAALGWDEMVADPDAILVVEWPSRLGDLIPDDALRVSLAHAGDDRRSITVA